MRSATIVPASSFPLPDLAAAFAACFEGYFFPVGSDPGPLASRIRTEHVDLAASPVVLEAEAPAALALIARRAEESRLAAMGVVTGRRGSGLGSELLDRILDEARERGDRRMRLEVIEQNHRAVRLYEGGGFRTLRRLVGWEGTLPEEPGPVEEVSLRDLFAAAARDADLPWQLEPQTLAGLSAPLRAFRLGGAVAAVSVGRGEALIRWLEVAAPLRRQGLAARLLRGIAHRLPGLKWSVPAIVPEGLADGFFAAQGLRPALLSQLEMAWTP